MKKEDMIQTVDKHRTELLNMLIAARSAKNISLYLRCKAILLIGEPLYTQGDAAKFCGVTDRVVRNWFKSFKSQGTEGLIEKVKPGPNPRLSIPQMEILKQIVKNGPEKYGIESGVWTANMIGSVIKKEFAVKYDVSQVRRILHKLGFSVQYPRVSLSKADLNSQFIWLYQTFPEIKKKPRRRKE